MAKNEFLPFGTAANANVVPNADYQALPARTAGFSSGVAKSEQLNTVWRQGSTMAAVLGQFIADKTGRDVLDDGDLTTLQENLQEALMNIMPVGIPQPWPTSTPPTGWLICNGSTFDKVKYPRLALAYPTGLLPDLRGEFIRGWDGGRSVDPGRVVLSSQSDEFKAHTHDYIVVPDNSSAGVNIFGRGGNSGTYNVSSTGGGETRPRNIAFNYIVRAA
ncbi:tail fiber protein [Serratia proteamaculans]|uniref:tail fiber protein n=1 Tax=Serratia proteamaculans TaxID=28151 RepID=UPI0024BB1D83|nr:tail fiber protein [Serratia proteamaculans]